ncbi:MAG: protease modulator HflC [Spirochaetales bacterium]|nr:protease modulator HflC [Spirochaetales bacterium]
MREVNPQKSEYKIFFEKNKKWFVPSVITAIIIVLFICLMPVYLLQETQCAVVTLFGKPVREVTNAGLHFKVPYIEKVNVLPKTIMEWGGEVRQFPTYDKRMILVDTTVRWKIKNPIVFFESLSTVNNAMLRLDNILDSASRQVVSQYPFESLVRDSNRVNQLDERTIELLLQQGFTKEDLVFPEISLGRSDLSTEMKIAAEEELDKMGIEIVNFWVKKINYIDDNLKSVYESMCAERQKIAQTYRSEGEKYREKKFGEIEEKTKEILASAQEEARQIMGEAEAKATEIYSKAYNRNESTREFYEFMKKMEAYRNIPENVSLVISTDSEFFDMLKGY